MNRNTKIHRNTEIYGNKGNTDGRRNGSMISRRIKWERRILVLLNGFLCIAAVLMVQKEFFKNSYEREPLYIGAVLYFVISWVIIRLFFYYKEKNRYLNSGILDVDKMSGIEFEYFLKFQFKRLGYKATTTAVTGDYGGDLILRRRREKIIVQAKRYRELVGIKAVQEVIGAVGYYGGDRGLVITNSYYTEAAINLAGANEVELWDRKKLISVMMGEEEQEDAPDGQEPGQPEEGEVCPWCKSPLVPRNGKYGVFLGCSAYPRCKYTRSIEESRTHKMH